MARVTASGSEDPGKLPVKARMWLGGMAATFPDIDYLSYLLDPLSFISDWHRGLTHSFIMLPLWALILGLMYARFSHNRHQWRDASIICGLSISSHILSDIITSWSTKILVPISDYSIALGTTFVIDPFFSMIIAAGLFLSIYRNSPVISGMALLGLFCYIGFQILLKQQVQEIAKSQANTHQWSADSIFIMPQPYLPYNWKIIIPDEDQYHVAHINLMAEAMPSSPYLSRLISTLNDYRSRSDLLWLHYSRYGTDRERAAVKSVWNHPKFERYRRFASFPAYIKTFSRDGASCTGFMDLRYTLPGHSTPFRYAVCQDLTDNSVKVTQIGEK